MMKQSKGLNGDQKPEHRRITNRTMTGVCVIEQQEKWQNIISLPEHLRYSDMDHVKRKYVFDHKRNCAGLDMPANPGIFTVCLCILQYSMYL